MKKFLLVGAGFSNAVIARELAEKGYKTVVVDSLAMWQVTVTLNVMLKQMLWFIFMVHIFSIQIMKEYGLM